MADPDSKLAVLKSRFGYDDFLPLQSEIIDNVLASRDALVLMPTGGGKSLCYQLPALLLSGTTLVVSPLIALMKDQVDALAESGIPAAYLNSSMSPSEARRAETQVQAGRVKLLYVAPERLASRRFRDFLRELDLSLIAIDEAHCISEWGHEFRPDYRNLRQLRGDFPSTPMIALTATATERVRADIVDQLGMQDGGMFVSGFNRSNLTYTVRPKSGAWEELIDLLKTHREQPAIIYCFSRQETEDLAADLTEMGFEARPYHAGLDSETRRSTQDDFLRDRVPIVVATIAFGMGIDKPDVRLVVHYSMPKSLEGYYQETGRAGRDGVPAECVLFYAFADKAKQDYFISQIADDMEQRVAREQLARMVEFAQLPTCRRKYLMRYFGEEWEQDNCGSCDVCLNPREEFDATEISQKILSAVIRTGEKFGAAHIIRVLRGGRDKRVLEMEHDKLSVYGIARDSGTSELREIVGQLVSRGLLTTVGERYPVLAMTAAGREFLQERRLISLFRPLDGGSARAVSDLRQSSADIQFDERLFEELRVLRRRLADEKDVPAFVVFGDVSLKQMAARFPQSDDEFSRISGVASAKLEQYGADFIAVIRAYVETHGRPVLEEPEEPATRTRPERRRGATYRETHELLSQGLSVMEIAEKRGIALTTVIGHIERIAEQDSSLELSHLMPDDATMQEIERAFEVCGDEFLRPAWEFLQEQVSYDHLRLARLHLRRGRTVSAD